MLVSIHGFEYRMKTSQRTIAYMNKINIVDEMDVKIACCPDRDLPKLLVGKVVCTFPTVGGATITLADSTTPFKKKAFALELGN